MGVTSQGLWPVIRRLVTAEAPCSERRRRCHDTVVSRLRLGIPAVFRWCKGATPGLIVLPALWRVLSAVEPTISVLRRVTVLEQWNLACSLLATSTVIELRL